MEVLFIAGIQWLVGFMISLFMIYFVLGLLVSFHFRVLELVLLPSLVLCLPAFSMVFFFKVQFIFSDDFIGRIVYAIARLIVLLITLYVL